MKQGHLRILKSKCVHTDFTSFNLPFWLAARHIYLIDIQDKHNVLADVSMRETELEALCAEQADKIKQLKCLVNLSHSKRKMGKKRWTFTYILCLVD